MIYLDRKYALMYILLTMHMYVQNLLWTSNNISTLRYVIWKYNIPSYVRTYIYSTFNNIQYWPDINQNNTLERTGGISTNMRTYSRTRSWGFPTCARLRWFHPPKLSKVVYFFWFTVEYKNERIIRTRSSLCKFNLR